MTRNSRRRASREACGALLLGFGVALGGPIAAHAQTAPPDAPVATAPRAPLRLNPTGRDVPLTSPLREGQFILGDIDFVLGADDSIRFNAQRFLDLIQPRLEPAAFDALKAKFAGRNEIRASDLEGTGFTVAYDPRTIGLVADIPATARPRQVLELMQTSPLNGRFVEPARFAAYLNARSSTDVTYTGSDKGLGNVLVLLDGAARFNGFVLEGEGSFDSDASTKFKREGTRLVYDRLDRTERWTFGDLKPQSRGFSGAPPMAGISVLRSYSVLEPQRNVQPQGQRSFTLVRPSTVEAFINGLSVRRVRLQPGTYDVRNFPFIQGANDVSLVITDDAGGQETINFSIFFDRTLLEPGLSEYGLFAGVNAPFNGSSRTYETSQPVASGYWRHGFSSRFTGGANFEAQKDGAVGGVEAVWASPIGTIGFDIAGSHNKGLGSGFAVNASYQRVMPDFGPLKGGSFSVTGEMRSDNFATPDEVGQPYPYKYEFGANYSQSIGENRYFSADVRYAKGRLIDTDDATARLTYGRRVNDHLNLTAEASYREHGLIKESGVRISLIYRVGRRSSISGEYDSRDNAVRAGFQTSGGRGVGAWSASANVDADNSGVGVDASYQRNSNRVEWGVNHTTTYGFDGKNIETATTSFRAASAFVYADGKFALARPVYDGFAIVAPHETLAGKTILIDPQKDGFEARSGIFGPAVMSNLAAFSPRSVAFDVPNAPAGYDFGTGTFRVVPPYRAGYLIIVGSDYTVTAIGRLVDVEGKPIVLLAGKATEIADPKHPAITIFTNRDGRFGAQGLRAGKWRVEMPTSPATTYILTIPEKAEGVVRLGDVQPEIMP